MTAWTEYDKWDDAFRDVVFGGAQAHQPVYLDVEDELLVEVAAYRGLDLTAEEAERALASDVRATLSLGPGRLGEGVFSGHQQRLNRWRWHRRQAESAAAAPSLIALLAVFARAAELMGRDEKFSSAAYFPRLFQLLAVDQADQQRLTTDYRRRTEQFWGALGMWLESLGGTRGLPTAEAMGHRYVGIALSQALIRDADRQYLIDCFVASELEPGLRLGHDDMAAYLEPWVRAGHGSLSMRKLLKSSGGRRALSEAASLALFQWDGTIPGQENSKRVVPPPLLTARVVRGALNASQLRLSFALRGSLLGATAMPSTWRVMSAPGADKPEVAMTTLTDRLLAPDLALEIDAESLLTGQLRIEPVEQSQSENSTPVVRKPQPLVLLNKLEEAGLFVEVERARLFEPVMLLVNAAARKPNGLPMFDMDDLLTEIAQPGFVKIQSARGLPDGWVLYREVVIAKRHERNEFALDVLKPAQTSAISVSGGFRMPGHAARWHADVPLDIGGVAPLSHTIDVKLVRSDDLAEETQVAEWATTQSEILETTSDFELVPGLYRVELHATGISRKDNTDSVATFAVCNSDEPRIRASSAPIGYPADSPTGALAAMPTETNPSTADMPIRGVVANFASPTRSNPSPCETVWWNLEQAPVERPVLAEPAAADSCAITGSHREEIETHYSGMRHDRAVCIGCGRVKLYRPVAPAKKAVALEMSNRRHSLGHLGTVNGPRAIRGETLLDALVWLGGGVPYELAHLVRQVDDSALTVDEVLRTLEVLGHIDVVRDQKAFEVQGWAVTPRSLAGLEDGSWFVAGAWNRSSIERLGNVVDDAAGTLVVDEEGWLPRRRIVGIEEPAILELAIPLEATVVPRAGRALLSCLRPLSDVVTEMPRTSVEGVFDAEWFNPATASWVQVQSIGEPGAYRLRKGFVNTYLFRTKDDVGRRTAARANPQIVKHLAAGSRPLLGYDTESETLLVPLGADLPGLYGRAVALLAGQPPSRIAGKPLLGYSSVPREVADVCAALMKEQQRGQ